jgi:PTS system nitrogen regulatory IIA component
VEGLDSSVGALIKLSEAVEFDSPDGEAVDLIFGLLVPADLNDQDQANVRDIAERLGSTELRAGLRNASSSSELYDALCA